MAILGSDIPEGKLGGTGHIGVRSTSSESGLITLRYTPASIHISPAILSGVSGHIGFRYTRRKIWCIWMYWCELYQLSWTFPNCVVTWCSWPWTQTIKASKLCGELKKSFTMIFSSSFFKGGG